MLKRRTWILPCLKMQKDSAEKAQQFVLLNKTKHSVLKLFKYSVFTMLSVNDYKSSHCKVL